MPVPSAPDKAAGADNARQEVPLLMITELFLPTKGGTAVSFDDDFRRLGGKAVHIVTAAVPGDAEFDRDHPNTIHRLVLERREWLRPESLLMYLRLSARSLRLGLSNRFAAVLAGRALPEGIVALGVGRLRGCKVMIYAHGEELTGWGRGRKFQAMCFALRHADHVLANSDFTRDTLVSLIGVRPERIVMTYPTVDAERFRPGLAFDDLRASIGLRPGQPLVLSVGRLQRRKGFDQVVRALPGLVRRGLDVHYAIVGIGDDHDYLEGLAREHGVAGRLHLLGHVDPADLPRWYNACSLFAMPNRDIEGDTEGFGLVFMEANACARPVISGRAGGTGSAVEDGLNGLRVDGEDVLAVEDAIARLLSNPDEARRMGDAGRQRTASRFTSDQRAALIRRVIDGGAEGESALPDPSVGRAGEPSAAGPRVSPPARRGLRILMYAAYLQPEYSGAALQALTLAAELRRRGHHVSFVTNRWPGLCDTAVVDGFPVRRLEPGRLRKHREFRLWYYLARHVWAHRADIDIIHSHGAYYTHAFVGPLARALGLRSLVKASLAHDDLEDLSRPVIGAIHRAMLRWVDACVGTSADLVGEFRAGGLKAVRIHHVPNGVDTERFRAVPADQQPALRRALGLPEARSIVLYVGVLDRRKNILWLAEQWIEHGAFGTGALLLAVGPQGRDDADGNLRARLVELARAHPERFALHDFRADVESYYRCADVLVLPSSREGLPNVVLEAMACSLPCVAARASGSRELIVDGETGFTYAPGDVDALGNALQRCLGPEGPAMGANARRLAEQRYSISRVADAYEALYARVLSSGPVPARRPAEPRETPR
ncbi:MAG TPA: glycosyltransferase family 4 protein [Rubrivivax sp.]|nr:glycosyltransferase family 4 protein [Rubrivivax sp.]